MKDRKNQDEIYSNPVRAGKRTYFFDVRATKANEYYLTITVSKRSFDENGNPQYAKHKIFLYKEDFLKFKDALSDTIDFIVKEKGQQNNEQENKSTTQDQDNKDFTDINFEDI